MKADERSGIGSASESEGKPLPIVAVSVDESKTERDIDKERVRPGCREEWEALRRIDAMLKSYCNDGIGKRAIDGKLEKLDDLHKGGHVWLLDRVRRQGNCMVRFISGMRGVSGEPRMLQVIYEFNSSGAAFGPMVSARPLKYFWKYHRALGNCTSKADIEKLLGSRRELRVEDPSENPSVLESLLSKKLHYLDSDCWKGKIVEVGIYSLAFTQETYERATFEGCKKVYGHGYSEKRIYYFYDEGSRLVAYSLGRADPPRMRAKEDGEGIVLTRDEIAVAEAVLRKLGVKQPRCFRESVLPMYFPNAASLFYGQSIRNMKREVISPDLFSRFVQYNNDHHRIKNQVVLGVPGKENICEELRQIGWKSHTKLSFPAISEDGKEALCFAEIGFGYADGRVSSIHHLKKDNNDWVVVGSWVVGRD
ncbi:MAG: hypothetical protein JRF33_22205 [Deltaproteobacteria bacterium]|nr:hypothetical protein [Deltaproteobacteria bacterium]